MTTRQSIFNALNLLMAQLDRESVVELIDLYLENSQKHLDAMNSAVSKRDLRLSNFEAHGLKSSSANLGALELSQVCLKVEKTTQIDAETLEKVQDIHRLFTEAKGIMQEWKIANRP